MNIQDILGKLDSITPLHGEITPLPTDDLLSTYESQTGFALPTDYKTFVKQFGVGELANFYQIFAPVNQSAPVNNQDIFTFNQLARRRPVRLNSYNNLTITDMLILFASSGGGDWFGWNSLELQSQLKYEYSIYYLGRDTTELSMVSLSFVDFLEICCRRSLWDERGRTEDWSFVRC
jgi:hypothetical protein